MRKTLTCRGVSCRYHHLHVCAPGNRTHAGFLRCRKRRNPKRDCIIQPRVARDELPWDTWNHNYINPNRGCGVVDIALNPNDRVDATSSRLVFNQTFRPKVARKLATFGFVAQSRWDWKSETGVACRSQRGSDFAALRIFGGTGKMRPRKGRILFLCALFRRLR